jgi:GTP-binding protein HflX
MSALSAEFVDAEVITPVANGRVLAYLGAHAEIYRQTYEGDQVVVRCFIPKHLVHHIQAPGVTVKPLSNGGEGPTRT